MNDRIPPLACPDLWQAVMAAAAGRCQCRGTCGKNHAKDGGRCPRQHAGLNHRHGGGTVHLIAAPADPADLLLPDHQAAALPKQRLAAWCPDCHHATRTAAHKAHRATAPAAEPDALFDL
ncbi:hypothetical protein GCM10010495_14520 [Kitasatospora herbaricolor]|uniref:hypothetical protein n=1 Tax=Kitasatospora herbaricolor TaxID=68217 RepID=UPI0019C68FA3|nr:hypothetical protein [Kitasatospora herbaricolor]MDQ0309259.1 hypothetical protein [Kitasatospora herbaricolor]GGV03967.1 hypothetical protein GCM10010495_14520 [Kitasatospora herbaricolor]